MNLKTHIAAYQGSPTIAELNEAIGLLVNQVELMTLLSKMGPFHPAFIRFIETEDVSELAPTGLMSPELYEATKGHVFTTIEHVSGRTVMGRYLSGKSWTGVLPEGSPLLADLTRGPCIVLHEANAVRGWLPLTREQLQLLGGLFNSVASKSKGRRS